MVKNAVLSMWVLYKESNSPTKLLFYKVLLLAYFNKYPQKYPLFFLLPPKKPSFADNHNKITTRLRQDYGKTANR